MKASIYCRTLRWNQITLQSPSWQAFIPPSSCTVPLLVQRPRTSAQWRNTSIRGVHGEDKMSQEEKVGDVSGGKDSRPIDTYKFSILSDTPAIFTSGELEFPIRRSKLLDYQVPLVVVLVSPSLATLFSDDGPFIPSLLRRAFLSLDMRQELDVLIAVVDRISSPSTHILRQAKLDPLNKTMSSEGISVLVTDSKKAAPDLWSTRKEAYESETTSIQQRCTLSFQFQPSTHDISASFRRHWTPVPYSSQTLDLPLTNTLFQNGRTSTLEAQRWAVTGILNSKPELSRTRRSVLPQQSLKIQRNCEQLSLAKLEIPLFYITPPRIVADSMGNIIRSFRDDGNSRGTVSASEELERAVKLETAEGEREACRIDVWALVIPREYWISQPRAMVQLNAVIESGGRLHRVLSGGGGWGNKQGLLSLEPDSMFTMSSKDPQTGFDDGFDFEAEKREALGEVARPGDVVQFLGRKDKGESRRLDFEEIENPLAMEINGLSSIVLGCIPSKMDTLPAYHVTNRNTTNQPYYLFIHNHFGALSEQGLGLGIETHGPKDTATFGAQSLGLVVQTKLPPNSIFRIENVNGRVDAKLVNQDKAKHNVVKLDTVKLNEL